MIKKIKMPLCVWLFFIIFAVGLTYFTEKIFYLFNFIYIGSFVAVGLFLFQIKWKHARLLVQLGVGLYMLIYLGIVERENMQLSGFFYYLFLGVFQAATIHYVVAKIAGPLLFGRGWCGYACWSAMVFDLLPFKIPKSHERVPKLGLCRYILFVLTLSFVGALFLFQIPDLEYIMFITFIVGNVIYYIIGIALAFYFKDNRAFCKYLCPITTFLKPFSYFAVFRVKKVTHKCINCKKCIQICPMDVDMLDNKRSRKNGTECILCGNCINACPKEVLKF